MERQIKILVSSDDSSWDRTSLDKLRQKCGEINFVKKDRPSFLRKSKGLSLI